MIQAGGLVIDTKTRSVEKDGAAVKLTRTEYKLLVALARQAGLCKFFSVNSERAIFRSL
jgi:DNA-binding response OmpR family regulator